MKKRKKKVMLWFLAGALIAGMGITLSMGMAIGSFTSALFERDGKVGVSPPTTLAHNNPTAVPGPRSALQTGSVAKGPGSAIRRTMPPVIVTKSAPQTHAKLPAENLWEDWSPEKALAHLSFWPGQAYPSSPDGAFVGLDSEGWNPTYTSRYAQNRPENRDAGSNSWLAAMGSTGGSYSGVGSFSSSGGSLRTASAELLTSGEPSVPASVPVPSSVLLLGSGILGLLGFMRRFKKGG